MAKRIFHPIFGQIEYVNGWRKHVEVDLFGQLWELEMIIDADEDADFEKDQEEAYLKFIPQINKLAKEAEEAIFHYYICEAPNYRAQLTKTQADQLVPILSNKVELGKLIEPKRVFFPMTFDRGEREAGFLLECSWEIEHGLGVKFINEKVEEIGFQDILL